MPGGREKRKFTRIVWNGSEMGGEEGGERENEREGVCVRERLGGGEGVQVMGI